MLSAFFWYFMYRFPYSHCNVVVLFILYRLLHPLSPRGKLVHWGLEGLAATNAMIDAAIHATTTTTTFNNSSTLDATKDDKNTASTIRLRDELYRIATSDEQKQQLQEIALAYPTIAEWKDDIHECGNNYDTITTMNKTERGPWNSGLRLHNGCCVLHVPSYLRGVYKACQIMAQNTNSTIRWCPILRTPLSDHMVNDGDSNKDSKTEQDEHYDATIYCYGSNMFQRSEGDSNGLDFIPISSSGTTRTQHKTYDCRTKISCLPVQLVRGQSMEVTLAQPLLHAVLCGKYISPLPINPDQPYRYRALIGATHEFSRVPLSHDDVITDLQTRTNDFVPFRYHDMRIQHPLAADSDTTTSFSNSVTSVDRITCGYRVQSTRSDYGRRPIIGKLSHDTSNHDWIFTGLSSRGLLYHAWYGQLLAQAIRQDDESVLLDACPNILWWKS